MKKIISAALISIFVVFAVSENAGSYEDGVAAYKREDYVTAAKLFRLSADQGNADGHYSLGWMYAIGRGVIQDYKEAAKWFRLSAAQGDAEAQSTLGLMCDAGHGVRQDYVRAHMWFSISASSGNKGSQSARDRVTKKMS